jgi:hypothetical protein
MNAPYNPSASALVGKTLIWLIVWVVVALIIFAITILFGSQMSAIIAWLWQAAQDNSPLLWMIMLVIAFLSSMVGTMLVAFIYGLMYGGIYPSVGKLTTYALITNVILFLLLAPLYMIVYQSVSSLFMVLGFHTILSVFITSVMNEISVDSQYSLSAIVGWLLGMSWVVFVFILIYKTMILDSIDIGWTTSNSQIQIMLSIPALLAYFLIPLAHGIWQKIYGSLYDMWSNFLYAPSWNERVVAAQMTENQEIIEEEINVEN